MFVGIYELTTNVFESTWETDKNKRRQCDNLFKRQRTDCNNERDARTA